jgi:hypothetical protein
MKYEPNKIKVDFGSYRHYWRGLKKVGKTSMFRDIVKEQYGDTKYGFLISTGNETGYKALDDIYAHETRTWAEFVTTTDDLIKNKDDNEFRVVAIDTIDELVAIAIQEAMDFHKRKTGKNGKSLNDILGGYGAGRQYVSKIINEQITKLERSGVGLVFIGHCKLRDIKEKGESEPYQILTSNLEAVYDNIFADKADIIATFITDKVVKDHKIAEKNRYIVFRDDGYIDSGSRLAGMPDRVPMSAKEYLKAFREGVQASKNSFSTDEDLELMRQEELLVKEKESRQFIESIKSQPSEESLSEEEEDLLISIDELRPKLNEKCTKLGGSKNEKLTALLNKYAEGGNFYKIKDIKVLNNLWNDIKEIE